MVGSGSKDLNPGSGIGSCGAGQNNSSSRQSAVSNLQINSSYPSQKFYGMIKEEINANLDKEDSLDEFDWKELNEKIWNYSPDPIGSQEEFQFEQQDSELGQEPVARFPHVLPGIQADIFVKPTSGVKTSSIRPGVQIGNSGIDLVKDLEVHIN